MTVLVISINDQVFDKKSAEVTYLTTVLETIKLEMGRSRGAVMSGLIIGQTPTGTASVSLGSWTYTPSASKP